MPNYRRLRKEGWVTHPKALRTLIALNGLQVGDEVWHRSNGRLHNNPAPLIDRSCVTDYTEYFREHGLHNPNWWHFLAWRRPK